MESWSSGVDERSASAVHLVDPMEKLLPVGARLRDATILCGRFDPGLERQKMAITAERDFGAPTTPEWGSPGQEAADDLFDQLGGDAGGEVAAVVARVELDHVGSYQEAGGNGLNQVD